MVGPGGLWMDWDLASNSLANAYNLMYAYEMDKVAFGIKLNRAADIQLNENPDYEYSRAYTAIGASLHMDVNDKIYGDLGFDYTMISYTRENTAYGDMTDDAGMKMDFNERLFYDFNETITFVQYLGFGMAEYNLKAEDKTSYLGTIGMSGLKTINFKFGLAADFEVNEDNLIVLGIEPFSFITVEPSAYAEDYDDKRASAKVTLPRFLLAYETDVKDWLTIRTGCTKAINGKATVQETGSGDVTTAYSEAPFDWHLGLAFHVSDFDIDCVLTNEAPFMMGHWLTGYESSNPVISRMTAVYHF
jgi:hypothetical protein